MTGRVVPFPRRSRRLSSEEGRPAAERVLATPIPERAGNVQGLQLEDPELLLCVCELLRARMETSPAIVKQESEFFYFFLEKPERKIGEFDEREYFLGELALKGKNERLRSVRSQSSVEGSEQSSPPRRAREPPLPLLQGREEPGQLPGLLPAAWNGDRGRGSAGRCPLFRRSRTKSRACTP